MTATKQAPCRRCGRTLTSAASIARGFGAWCARLQAADEQAAIRAEFTAAQNAGADEAIELGALVPAGHGAYITVGTNGDRYLTSADFCNCPARKPCKHQLAARLLDLRARYLHPLAPAAPTAVTTGRDVEDVFARL